MLGVDTDAADTARRELAEETGAQIVTLGTGEDLRALRSLYTDTGKLLDRPAYYLAFVERELAKYRLQKLGPVMEDPVWVHMEQFLRAVFSERSVRVEDADFVLSTRSQFFARTGLDSCELDVCDAFTVTAALLALPHLAKHFRDHATVDASIFDTGRYV